MRPPSLLSGDKHKRMRKVVYYETDTSSTSTSDSDAPSVTSKRQERKKYSKIPLRYPRISNHTPLLSVPLGKPPMFEGEDYSMWSDKMRHHLTSLHKSIWDIVEYGAQVPKKGDKDYDSEEVEQIQHFNSQATTIEGEDYSMWSDKMRHHLTSLHKSIWDIVEYGAQVPKKGDKDYDSEEVEQIQHFNSQATTILLASLSREEYNKVQGLKSAKEIWDVLKTEHEGEGDELTKITKRETIEGELGRFMLNQGEDPQAMYNRLKTLVNQVRNLGSTKWDDHEMVKVILRSLVFLNPTQVQLIRGDPRYKLMSPEEIIGKFVSFELMIKGSSVVSCSTKEKTRKPCTIG